MPVFRCNKRGLSTIDNVFLNSFLDNICKVSMWCDVKLYNLIKGCLEFSPKSISWKSPSYSLNPNFSVEAVSKAAKENRGGVSPLGSSTSVNPYMIPTMNYDSKYTDVFIIVNPTCFGIIQPKAGFIIVGIISPKTLDRDYIYVYTSSLSFSEPLDARIADFKPTDKLFMCFPIDCITFHGEDNHDLFINIESYKQRQSMRLQVGVDKKGNPIYAPFAFDKGILNFDTCLLSNGVFDNVSLPSEKYFINETKTAHPRNVNTLNDITNIKTIDIFVRDGDRKTLYKFFSHIDHLAHCSSYNFTYWYTTKIDYPVAGKKWFLWDIYSDVPYHGLALLLYYVYFSATEFNIDKSSLIIDIDHKIDYACSYIMSDDVYGVDLLHIHDYNHVYGGSIPDGSILIIENSPVYTIFFGDSNKVVCKLIEKKDLLYYADNNINYIVNDIDNGFSISFSFYNNMWNVLVPINHNCFIFDIYISTSIPHGGDFNVISSIQ